MRTDRTDRVFRPSGVSAAVIAAALLAGGAGIAHADVTSNSYQFRAEVPNLREWDGVTLDQFGFPLYVDNGVNQSFDVTGGAELLPFSRIAEGGAVRSNFEEWQNARVVASGSALSQGGITSTFVVSAGRFETVFADFSSIPNASGTQVFTIDEQMNYALVIDDFGFSNDLGAGSIGLREVGSDTLVLFRPLTPPPFPLVFEGVLGPGTYEFWGSAVGSAGFNATLAITNIPAPATVGVIAGVGVLGARRRR